MRVVEEEVVKVVEEEVLRVVEEEVSKVVEEEILKGVGGVVVNKQEEELDKVGVVVASDY